MRNLSSSAAIISALTTGTGTGGAGDALALFVIVDAVAAAALREGAPGAAEDCRGAVLVVVLSSAESSGDAANNDDGASSAGGRGLSLSACPGPRPCLIQGPLW